MPLAYPLLILPSAGRGATGNFGRKIGMIPVQDAKATRILAKSLFKELRGNGYSPNQILSLSTELIDLVTKDLRSDQAAPAPKPDEPASGAWRAAL